MLRLLPRGLCMLSLCCRQGRQGRAEQQAPWAGWRHACHVAACSAKVVHAQTGLSIHVKDCFELQASGLDSGGAKASSLTKPPSRWSCRGRRMGKQRVWHPASKARHMCAPDKPVTITDADHSCIRPQWPASHKHARHGSSGCLPIQPAHSAEVTAAAVCSSSRKRLAGMDAAPQSQPLV